MTTRFGKLICVFVCCSVAVIVAYLASVIYPASTCGGQVKVSISNLPPGTAFASVASDRNGEIQSMNWIVGTAFVKSEMHPANCNWRYQLDRANPKVDWNAFVAWREGDRYGVVTWDAKGAWRVAWFSTEVCKGEFASFDYSQAAPIPLNDMQVKALGLLEANSGLLR